MNEISISCASDEAYYCGLLVTLHSLVSHAAQGTSFICHVLDTGLCEESRRDLRRRLAAIPGRAVTVRFHTVDAGCFEGLPKWRGGYTAYVRLLLQDILADEEFTVYTDIDTLWLRDVCELWNMRHKVPVLAAVPDGSGLPGLSSGGRTAALFAEHGLAIDAHSYFCSGLFLMNLKELRARGFSSLWMDFLRKNPGLLEFPDQNLYNFFFPAPDTLLLDWRWGEFSTAYGVRGITEPRVVHYARQAPWKKKITAVGMLWWNYLHENIGDARLGRAAGRRRLMFRMLRNPVVFNLIYSLPALFNRKVYKKRKAAIFPETQLSQCAGAT
jgi:lipopolysaccharide biosynthesis glycosyltransferase